MRTRGAKFRSTVPSLPFLLKPSPLCGRRPRGTAFVRPPGALLLLPLPIDFLFAPSMLPQRFVAVFSGAPSRVLFRRPVAAPPAPRRCSPGAQSLLPPAPRRRFPIRLPIPTPSPPSLHPAPSPRPLTEPPHLPPPPSATSPPVLQNMALNHPEPVFSSVLEFASVSSQNTNPKYQRAAVLGRIAEGCSELMKDELEPLLGIVLEAHWDAERWLRAAAATALRQFVDHLQPVIVSQSQSVLPCILSGLLEEESCLLKENSYHSLQALRDSNQQCLTHPLEKVRSFSAMCSVAAAADQHFVPYAERVLEVLTRTASPCLQKAAATRSLGLLAVHTRSAFAPYLEKSTRVIDMPISTPSNQPRVVDTESSSQDNINDLTEPAKVRDQKKRPSNSPFRGVLLLIPKMNLVPEVLVGPIMAFSSSSKLLIVCLVAGFLVFACAHSVLQLYSLCWLREEESPDQAECLLDSSINPRQKFSIHSLNQKFASSRGKKEGKVRQPKFRNLNSHLNPLPKSLIGLAAPEEGVDEAGEVAVEALVPGDEFVREGEPRHEAALLQPEVGAGIGIWGFLWLIHLLISSIFVVSSLIDKSDFIVLTSTHINVVISWNRLTKVSSLLVLGCSMVAYSILTSLGSCIARVFGLAGFWFHWSLQCISIASPLHGCPLDFFKSTRGFFLMVTQALSSNLGRAEFRNLFQVTSLWVSVIVCIKHRRSFAAIFVSIWSSCSAAASHMLGELDGIHTASPGVVDLFASKVFDYLPQQASSTDLPLNLLSFSSLHLVFVCTFCLHDCPIYWIRHDIILFLRIYYVSCVIVYSY